MLNADAATYIGKILLSRHQNIAVAESVTAGLIQNNFAAAENAADFFEGGVTTYNLAQKTGLLGVDAATALACDCVSAQVAAEMAKGVSTLFAVTYGIGITGYAVPVPELHISDLFAFYALCFEGKIILEGKITSPGGDRISVQEYFVSAVLQNLSEALKKTLGTRLD